MDLFNTERIVNLLPKDGIVNYHGKIIRHQEGQHYFDCLLKTIAWKNDEHGSLLIMKGATQSNWLHSLPKSKKISRPRINLTFRTIVI